MRFHDAARLKISDFVLDGMGNLLDSVKGIFPACIFLTEIFEN